MRIQHTHFLLLPIQIVGNRNPEQEGEILEWIEAVLGTKLPEKP